MFRQLVVQAFDKAIKETGGTKKYTLCKHIQDYLHAHAHTYGNVYKTFERVYERYYKNTKAPSGGIPQRSTLDMLAQYLSYANYQDFLDHQDTGRGTLIMEPAQLQSLEQMVGNLENLLGGLDIERIDGLLKKVFENHWEAVLNSWGEDRLLPIFEQVLEEKLRQMEKKLARSRKLYKRFGSLGLFFIGIPSWEKTLGHIEKEVKVALEEVHLLEMAPEGDGDPTYNETWEDMG